ncbi:MAG: energy-coupled thiamine transporter ThiT [Clostridia bacterium]|nr:energy-coupled thiamine transporter ThiT [Clostridia bacterium]
MSDYQVPKQLARRDKIMAVVTGGICIALSEVLSMIKLFEMPMGGAVTPAATLPLIIFCLCFGPLWGFGACLVFSVLQIITGYMMTPFQVILDYVLAYGLVGVVSFACPRGEQRYLKNTIKRLAYIKFVPAILLTILGFFCRFGCSVLSGVIFYSEYAGDMNPWIYSITYNGTFMLPEAGITLVLMLIVLGILRGTNKKKT